jgi:hypothetical protein
LVTSTIAKTTSASQATTHNPAASARPARPNRMQPTISTGIASSTQASTPNTAVK